MNTPIVLVVFNRPDITKRVFGAIAQARPNRLLIVADGPRADQHGEADRCAAVREIVSRVDWPCQVDTNFADENMGCRRRVISGLNWAFSLVEEAIILEDDCLPDPSFFPFCSEMLERFRDQEQIGFIAGFNPLENYFPFRYSYFFSLVSWTWGWATWGRAWRQYDEQMISWPKVKQDELLHILFPSKRVVSYWSRVFDRMHGGTGPNTWDYQWFYTCWTRNWLSIIPSRNLIQNVGFGSDSTHTTEADPDRDLPARSVSFPLLHPPVITAWPSHAMQTQLRFFAPGIPWRIRFKVLRLLRRKR